jgi:hypothetical protein
MILNATYYCAGDGWGEGMHEKEEIGLRAIL